MTLLGRTLSIFLLLYSSLHANERIQIVGSSTIYPFATTVAEEFSALHSAKTPLIESTGSGSGIRIFCNKTQNYHIANASRRIKPNELKRCQDNTLKDILELPIGFDGIALAQHVADKKFNLSKKSLMLALIDRVPSKDGSKLIANPYKKWSDIDPNLPKRDIHIYGPPTSSGTRDILESMILKNIANTIELYRDKKFGIRKDGAYIPSGENDNLIIQKLKQDRDAIGIFGYNFLMENEDKVSGIAIDGVYPTQKSIANRSYPITRVLYLYVNIAHLKSMKSLQDYLKLFMSDTVLSPDGILVEMGLVPLLDSDRAKARNKLKNKTPLSLRELKKDSLK